jgi:hypothetical protein
MDRHRNFLAVAAKRFVDRVVNDLKHHMVQSGTVIGVTDVHAGAFADSL